MAGVYKVGYDYEFVDAIDGETYTDGNIVTVAADNAEEAVEKVKQWARKDLEKVYDDDGNRIRGKKHQVVSVSLASVAYETDLDIA